MTFSAERSERHHDATCSPNVNSRAVGRASSFAVGLKVRRSQQQLRSPVPAGGHIVSQRIPCYCMASCRKHTGKLEQVFTCSESRREEFRGGEKVRAGERRLGEVRTVKTGKAG